MDGVIRFWKGGCLECLVKAMEPNTITESWKL